MARPSRVVLGTTADYARAEGVSLRTARRRAHSVPGAVKTGRGWVVPLTTREAATAYGISQRTALRRSIPLSDVPRNIPSNLDGRGKAPTGGARRRAFFVGLGTQYAYQGHALVHFIRSDNTVIVHSGILEYATRPTKRKLRSDIMDDISRRLTGSDFEFLKVWAEPFRRKT